jgi:hypothetical protein
MKNQDQLTHIQDTHKLAKMVNNLYGSHIMLNKENAKEALKITKVTIDKTLLETQENYHKMLLITTQHQLNLDHL